MDLASLLNDDTLRRTGYHAAVVEVGKFVYRMPEHGSQSPAQRVQIGMALQILDRVVHAGIRDERLLHVRLMTLGKLGQFKEVLRIAQEHDTANPSWDSASMLANVYRRLSDLRGAVMWYQKAAERDPNDVTAFLDAGDCLLELKDWHGALGAYESALRRYPAEPWALPSAAFCRLQIGDHSQLDKLRKMAALPPDECGVADMIAGLTGNTPPTRQKERAIALLEQHQSDS